MHTYRSLVSLLAIPILAFFVPTASAQEIPYPAPAPMLTVSSSTATVNSSVDVHGTGFAGGEVVTIDVTTSSAQGGAGGNAFSQAITVDTGWRNAVSHTVTTGPDGSFTTSVTFSEIGVATITATGASSGLSASARVTVIESAAGLPTTGNDSTQLLAITLTGTAAVLLGSLILGLVAWRRRRTNTDM